MQHENGIDHSKGVAAGLFSAFAFGLMGFLVHCERGKIPASEVSFVRALVGFLLLLPFTISERKRIFSVPARAIWLRSLAGSLSVLCYFFNLQQSSVGSATALADLSPVFVVVLSAALLREKVTVLETLGIAIAVGGVTGIHAQSFFFMDLASVSVGLAGAFFSAVAYVSLRRASVRFSSQVIVCCFSGVTAASSVLMYNSTWHWPTGLDSVLLAGVAVSGLAGQILMTRSYLYLKASVACGLGTLALFWGVFWDVIFHGEYPTPGACVGYVLLVVGVYLLQARRLKGAS